LRIDPSIQVLIAISLVISMVFAVSLWRSNLYWKWKCVFTLVLLPPVVGPFMYFWIRNFPAPAREDLRGHRGGLGRKFLDAELHRNAETDSLYHVIDKELSEHEKRRKRK